MEKIYNLDKSLSDTEKKGIQIPPDTSSPEHKARVNLVAKKTAAQLNYRGSLSLEDKDHEFELNGEKQYAAGTYDKDTGHIKLYPKRLRNPDEAGDILAHEIGHHKFQTVMGAARKEWPKIDASKEHQDKYIKDLWDEQMQKDYPATHAVATHLNAKNFSRLKSDDGVTDYSRDWWKHQEAHPENQIAAIDETHAEISMLARRAGMKADEVLERHRPPGLNKKELVRLFLGVDHRVKQSWLDMYDHFNRVYEDHASKESKDK